MGSWLPGNSPTLDWMSASWRLGCVGVAVHRVRELWVVCCLQDRIGGRIHTFKSGQYVADLGAMVITGLGGNPLSVLKRQLGLHMSKIHRRCPLYFTTGEIRLLACILISVSGCRRDGAKGEG